MSMRRRDFNRATAAAVAVVVTGCGGGGGGGSGGTPAPASGSTPPPAPGPSSPSPAPSPGAGGSTPSPSPSSPSSPTPPPPPPPPAPTASGPGIGVNLVGMQAANGNLRYGLGTQVNVNWEVPRKADVAWLAANGYSKNRLPIQWEMLQPVLFDTNINAATRAIVGNPGEFNAAYQSYITSVLDAHAAAGIKCFLDLHNYCRYTDFRYQPDGSVIGLTKPADPTIYPYTSDANQVYTRIFATAAGATLTPAHFVDFWTRAAKLWKDHPGFGGYGLMNEPYNLPAPGGTTETTNGDEDQFIWPTFAKAAVDAIRAIDPVGTIYLDSNQWSAAWSLPTNNPAWPIQGANLVYEVHMYLDAGSSGQRFDYDYEVSRNFSAGFGNVPITLDTGWQRLKPAVDWAAARNLKLALSETGMPIDDPRWQEMFQRLTDYARANNVEIYPWDGGSHWPLHNYAINFVPGWHQNRTLEPAMSGVLKKSAGIASATIFDDGPGYALAGTAITVTVYARGYLANPVTVAIASDNGGTLSTSSITIPAGANPQATYTFTPAADRVTTLTYTVSGGLNAPPPRKVYSLVDPVGYATTSLADAARAVIAKYSACKWEAGDGYTDYELGAPAQPGQQVRAIADSGYGSSAGNAMEMLNWMNTDVASMANLPPAVMRVINGHKATDHSGASTSGFWCKKTVPLADVEPNPRNVVPYTIGDPHFMVAAVSSNGSGQDGVIFQASKSTHVFASQLVLAGGRVQAQCSDETGTSVTLGAPAALATGAPAVLTFASQPGAQQLRVNSNVVATGSAKFFASVCDQLLMGWGFQQYYPRQGFGGNIFAVVTGKGSPSAAELQVIESYLGSLAGM